MSARVSFRGLFLRPVALGALVGLALLAEGSASPLIAWGIESGVALSAKHAARGACPALPATPYERESAEGRSDTPAPGCDPVCLSADALPRRPTRLASSAAARPCAALALHRAHSGSESCSGTSLPPP